MHGQAGAVLDRAADLVDVGEVHLRVDALAEHVHGQGDEADVAGSFAVTEQAPLHAVGPRHQGELGRRDGRAPVVVRVQRDRHVVAVGDVAPEVLDLVGVGVRGGPLHGRGQVEDDLAARTGLPDLHHVVTDLNRQVGGRLREDLGTVLVAELHVAQFLFGVLQHQFGAAAGQRDALGLADAEHHASEKLGRGVVEVDVGPAGADQRLRGALDEVRAPGSAPRSARRRECGPRRSACARSRSRSAGREPTSISL
jgi:hypothetical protein